MGVPMLRKILLVLTLSVLLGCSGKVERESLSFMALNTTCSVTIFNSPGIDISEVEEIVLSVENKMSRFPRISTDLLLISNISDIENLEPLRDRFNGDYNTSDIVMINSRPEGEFYTPDSETLEVVKEGIKYSILSNGAFDITIGPLADLWAIGKRDTIPHKSDILNKLEHVDYRDIEIVGDSIRLKREEMSLDLGGIAKGYAADKVREHLTLQGVNSALINLGGNIYVIGSKQDGSSWNIGIQHPREQRGEFIGVLKLKNSSLISSGDYERFFMEDGVRYHHILDTKTGYPKSGEVISSSIVSEDAVLGDALSTITFGESIFYIKELRKKIDFEGVFVTRDKSIYVTEKLKDIFTLNDNRYRLIYD